MRVRIYRYIYCFIATLSWMEGWMDGGNGRLLGDDNDREDAAGYSYYPESHHFEVNLATTV